MFIFSSFVYYKSILTNIYIGYLLIPDSNISGIAYEELPHGINVNITFGIHNRKFVKKSVLMPE